MLIFLLCTKQFRKGFFHTFLLGKTFPKCLEGGGGGGGGDNILFMKSSILNVPW